MAELLEYEGRDEDVVPTDVARKHARLSWGAIFGGTFSALGLWLLLYVFGLAIGFSTVHVKGGDGFRPSGMFVGIWALISPLVALFVGGWVAGRGAGVVGRSSGAVHGLVMWGLTTVLGATVAATTVSALLTSAFAAGHDLTVTGDAARAFWGMFGALLLGLLAAVIGGFTGAGLFPRRTRTRRERVVVTQPPVPPPREVYP
jgi:hypothetical protein